MESLINSSYKQSVCYTDGWNGKARLIVILVSIVMLFASSGYADEFDIVRDGKATMVIVIPDNTVECVQRAAWELQYHVKEASGSILEIVRESAIPQTNRGRIYIGGCEAAKRVGIVTDKLTHNGFIIKTIGSNLFLTGRDTAGSWRNQIWPSERGTLLAVYNFLDRQMGVRWLWPGKLGEVIPKVSTVSVGKLDQTVSLPLMSSRFGAWHWNAGWSNPQAREQFKSDEDLWMNRQYFYWNTSISVTHFFGKYWEMFGKSHPEYFNLLPDGTRRSDPHYFEGARTDLISMCVSEPNLWNQIIEDWKATRTKKNPNICVAENDTPGRCCCSRCMSWDVPDKELDIPWDKRLDYAKEAFAKGDAKWTRYLGGMSDRYARFYMEILKLARQVDPNVYVMGFAYANYTEPPIQTELNDHIVIYYVGKIMYPWTPEKIQKDKDMWTAWADTGVSQSWRPNFMLDGHNMPIFIARKFANLYTYFYKRGMLGTYFDSNTGQYSTQGPNLYVLARMQYYPDKPVDEILDEYYGAFGPAEAAVREYFTFWEHISDSVTDETCKGVGHAAGAEVVSGWDEYYKVAGLIFKPEVMAKGHAILNKAADVAKGDKIASARVDYLMKGLKNTELTLAAQDAYDKYKISGDASVYQAAIKTLDGYRASVEADNIANMGYLYDKESRNWDRSFLKFSDVPSVELDTKWKFMFDPNNEGINKEWSSAKYDDSKWFSIGTNSCWEEQPVGKQWEQDHGNQYNGFAWYRNQFVVTSDKKPQRKILAFGAVDEACKIWINGQLVLDRPFPYKGDGGSWAKVFEVDITDYVRYDQPNVLAVRVEDNSGGGGIWRPVKLLFTKTEE